MNYRNHNLIRETLTESEEDIALVLGSLANRRRLKMLTSLLKGPSTFKELQKETGLGKTALAHHLGQLVETGLLKHTGRGRYELSPDGAELLQAVGEAYRDSRRRRELEAARRADYIQKVHDKRRLKREMEELKVRIVELEPMRVASVRAISETPEHDAWQKMREWAEPKGFLEDIEKHPVFGFNNPNPSLNRKDYGYEFWMRVGPDIKSEGDIKIKEFEGGLYAVITCNLKQELESEFFQKEGYLESWKKLTDWVKSGEYEFGQHQCLERAHDPDASVEEMVLDLYCSIEK
jgi:DNA-binding HxlR family transcriptional regulator/DNA gyrase inhibitor GyrI